MAASIAENLRTLRQRIEAAAIRVGRRAEDVVLVGVAKTQPAERVAEALAAGLADVGENKVQEARDKVPLLSAPARWHLVGHLQANKANQAARLFDVVHSIDSVGILERLERGAEAAGRRITGLVQVDLAGEPTKSGAGPEDLEAVLRRAASCAGVAVRGLMILPPYDADPERTRPWFRRLRALIEEARARHPGLDLRELSMGMTEDFEVAIEEGATMVRIGRALFGERRIRARSSEGSIERTP
jgi:hypothetical protein